MHDRKRKITSKGGASPLSVPVAMLLGGAAGIGYFAGDFNPASLWAALPVKAAVSGSNCSIKGNISIDTGERIYHVPGQRYYAATKIRAEYGERWFCSETEALQAGWRRSRT